MDTSVPDDRKFRVQSNNETRSPETKGLIRPTKSWTELTVRFVSEWGYQPSKKSLRGRRRRKRKEEEEEEGGAGGGGGEEEQEEEDEEEEEEEEEGGGGGGGRRNMLKSLGFVCALEDS